MRPDLAALVGSRICHDLISPIGAIGNGVELLSLTDGDTSAERALIAESVENANARIRFFRIAYGATAEGQMVARSEILSVLSAAARGGRFTYFWQIEGELDRRSVRIAFLVLQCLEAAMPMGGDITVSKGSEGWALTGTCGKFKFDEVLWQSLTDPRVRVDHTATHVQFALLPGVVAEARATLAVERTPEAITVRF